MKRFIISISLGCAALLVLTPILMVALHCYTEVGIGGFLEVEFQLHVIDQKNQSVKGVKLEVTDDQGRVSFGYPVTDYLPGAIPETDADGHMVFHHVNFGPEYTVRRDRCLIPSPRKDIMPPRYVVFLVHGGKRVYSSPYSDYFGSEPDWAHLAEAKVKRVWKPLAPMPESVPPHLRPENCIMPQELEYYVVSRTIKIDVSSR